MVNARDYPEYRDVLLSTFMWGMLVMGLYGVVQYFVMPQWDVLWMIGSDMERTGRAGAVRRRARAHDELMNFGPFRVRDHGRAGVRVRRAAEDPLVRRGGRLRVVRASVFRSTWGGWVIALAIQLAQSNNLRMRILIDQRRRAGRPVRRC